jgi:hypothetical protein
MFYDTVKNYWKNLLLYENQYIWKLLKVLLYN